MFWTDPLNDDQVRWSAFKLWTTGANGKKLDALRSVPPESILFERALAKRAELGDKQVLPELLARLSGASSIAYLLQFAHGVWGEEMKGFTRQHLASFASNIPMDFKGGRLNCHYAFSRLLRHIPAEDAQALLEEHWGHLGYSRLFIQTAIYVGSPTCLRLARSSIERCPNDIPYSSIFISISAFLIQTR